MTRFRVFAAVSDPEGAYYDQIKVDSCHPTFHKLDMCALLGLAPIEMHLSLFSPVICAEKSHSDALARTSGLQNPQTGRTKPTLSTLYYLGGTGDAG